MLSAVSPPWYRVALPVRLTMLLLLVTVAVWRVWTMCTPQGLVTGESVSIGAWRMLGIAIAGRWINERFVEGAAAPATVPDWWFPVQLAELVLMSCFGAATVLLAVRTPQMLDSDLMPIARRAPLQRAGALCLGAALIVLAGVTASALVAGTSLAAAPGTGPLVPLLAGGCALALCVSAAAALDRAGIALR